MTPSTSVWRRPLTGVVSLALLAGLAVSGLPAAQASPIGDARARAAALRHQVDQLRQQAEVATEDYDAPTTSWAKR